MGNLVIPRRDDFCALCRTNVANQTGSHMVPNLLTSVAFTFDGLAKRDREIVLKHHLNFPEENSTFYGRGVSPDKISQDLGHDMTDEEIEKNINTLCYDNIFCKECEKRFGVLETAFGEYYRNGKEINPKLAYLFWLSVFWRMSIGYMGIFMDAKEELELRSILQQYLKSQEEIINTPEKELGNFGYVVFRLNETIRKGDSGILGTKTPKSPYIILVADYVVILFADVSKLHRKTIEFGWEIDIKDINTPTAKEYIEFDMNIQEFYEFRKLIVERSYAGIGQAQEPVARAIREKERGEGKAVNKTDFYKLMQILKEPQVFHVRQAYRFRVAYMKMLEAAEKGEAYDYLNDRELMLNQQDVDNYVADLKKAKEQGISLLPFAFAKEFLNDDSLPSFKELLHLATETYSKKKLCGL